MLDLLKDLSLYTTLLWLFFIAAANTKEAYERSALTALQRALAKPFVYLFFIVDIAYNITYGSVLYLEMPHPKRLTLSQRVQDILDREGSKIDQYWRKPIGKFMSMYMINPFAPGHINLSG